MKRLISLVFSAAIILSTIALPVVCSAEKIFNVDGYGAKINDEKVDSGDAVRSAIDAAIKNGGGEIVFSKGTYYIGPKSGAWAPGQFYFNYKGVKNLTFKGNETKIVFTDSFVGGFLFNNSQDIKITGFHITYKNSPFTQGFVKAVNPSDGTYDMEVMDDFTNMLDDPRHLGTVLPLNGAFGMIRDKNNPILLKKTAVNFFRIKSYSKLSDKLYRMVLEDSNKSLVTTSGQIETGDGITYSNRGINGSMFRFEYCNNVEVSNSVINKAVGTLNTSTYCSGKLVFDNIKVLREGTSWITANADGFHMQGNTGSITITNCEIEALADDFINIYQVGIKIAKVEASDRIMLNGNLPSVGGEIMVYGNEKGKVRGHSKIKELLPVNGSDIKRSAILVLETPIENIDIANDYLYSMQHSSNNTVIKDNVFREARGNGILLRANNALIEGNLFKDNMGVAVEVYNSPPAGPFNEGYGAENLVVRNNIMENNCYLVSNITTTGIITIESNDKDEKPPANNINKDIIIEGNKISPSGRYGIYATSIDGLTIKDNIIVSPDATGAAVANSRVGIFVANINKAEISGNSIIDTRPAMKGGIEINDTCIDVSAENNQIKVADGVKEIIDSIADKLVFNTDIPKSKSGLNINGDINNDDWGHAARIYFNKIEQVAKFNTIWNVKDLGGTAYLMWDEINLYVAAKVLDNKHVQSNVANRIWASDCLQFSFDKSPRDSIGKDGFYEFTAGLTEKGESLLSMSFEAKQAKEVNDIKFVAKRIDSEGATNYTLAIPWKTFGISSPKMDDVYGFSMLFNDDDSTGRKGWIEWGSGIGASKDPTKYGTINIVSETTQEYEPEIIVDNNQVAKDPADTRVFKDIDGHWAEQAILKMAAKNILKGKQNKMFDPEGNVTRAEFIVLLLRASEMEVKSFTNCFNDVGSSDWFANEVQTAMDRGIIDSVIAPDGFLKPNQALNRQEMCMLAVRAWAVANNALAFSSNEAFPDSNKIADWALPYALFAKKIGAVEGMADGTFAPMQNFTRAEAAILVNRLLIKED